MAQDPSKVIRQRIAETRAGVTSTIDAIQQRVPRSVLKRAKEIKQSTVGRMKNLARSAGSTAGSMMARTAKTRGRVMKITREHPVPAAVVSAAAVWLLVRTIRNGRRRSYLYEEAL